MTHSVQTRAGTSGKDMQRSEYIRSDEDDDGYITRYRNDL